MSSPVLSATVLGKRKALVLHLSPSPSVARDSDSESTTVTAPPILVNGTLVPNTKKRYQCTYTGCTKAYSKPSRLDEHARSHTGQRPFICESCGKSYLREAHLQTHSRSHLPSSARLFICEQTQCGKRFWTAQHLRVHTASHNGAKPFVCPDASCEEAFAKHHQLRAHACKVHAPAGTKPYQCEYDGCAKSFSTNQKLRAHVKVHDDQRYTCVQSACLPVADTPPTYYPTWTALQHHLRTVHPPACSHPSCNGRIFASQKGLRAHQKLHEQQEVDAELGAAVSDSDNEEPLRKKRRGGEFGRDWKCEFEGCEKDFKSKKALMTHNHVTHLGLWDHVCPYDGCGRSFGYKHLLQRHLAKSHSTSDSCSGDDAEARPKPTFRIDIGTITGEAYASRAQERVHSSTALRCPYPHMESLAFVVDAGREGMLLGGSKGCDYVFSRAYDLRRHLRAEHGIETDRGGLDEWVKDVKARDVSDHS